MIRSFSTRRLGAAIWLAICLGCGSSDQTVPRFEVSGTVTHAGVPVSAGFISFNPDTARGNSGPGGAAPIKDGYYCTPPDQRIVGGPHLVKIVGFDGVPVVNEEGEDLPEGRPLFLPFNIKVDALRGHRTRNFDVPEIGL